jgi:hypothetical protein
MPQLPIHQYVATQTPEGNIQRSAGARLNPNVAPVLAAAKGLLSTYAVMQEQQDRAQVSDLMADATLQWAQNEQQGRASYDPAKGTEHTPATLKAFDEYKGTLVSKAKSPQQAEMIRQHMDKMRPGVGLRAIEFEAHTRVAYRRQVLGETLEKRTAAAELDPSQAMELMAQQVASIEESNQLNPVERAEFLAQAKGSIALGAARSLAMTNPGALREHPVFEFIPAAHLPDILKAAQKSEVMTTAQTVADGLMAQGLPMDQAMRQVEQTFEGEEERAVKAEVLGRYSYAVAARKDAEQEIYGTAQLEVEERGRVTPQTWAKLTDTHRAAILNRQQAEARQRRLEAAGTPVKTDFGLYVDLRQAAMTNPGQFARMDLKQYVDKIAPAQLEQLIDLKAKAADPKTQRDAVTLTQQMNATMSALGIKKAEKKGQFLSYVQAAIDDAAQAGGKPLTFDQRQQIIDRAVLQGPDPSAWFFGEKRLFELTPDERTRFKPNAATDAPATEIEALNEALAAQGLPQTPANRLALYERSMRADQ